MKPWQKAVRYGAIALALILIVNIASCGLKIIGGTLNLASLGTLDEAKLYEFDSDTDSLEINISAAMLAIRFERCEKITVKSNLKGLTVKERSGNLKINDNKGFLSVNETEGFVEIMIPEGVTLREIDLDLGAGKTVISSIKADRVDIDGGAGELLIRSCDVSELDLDMGVGVLDFHGSITDKADISLGVGKTDITLLGGKDKYKLVLEKGIGEIKVDGETVGNTKLGEGECTVDIDGGVGEININFE